MHNRQYSLVGAVVVVDVVRARNKQTSRKICMHLSGGETRL
jgi:hypothetical protein